MIFNTEYINAIIEKQLNTIYSSAGMTQNPMLCVVVGAN